MADSRLGQDRVLLLTRLPNCSQKRAGSLYGDTLELKDPGPEGQRRTSHWGSPEPACGWGEPKKLDFLGSRSRHPGHALLVFCSLEDFGLPRVHRKKPREGVCVLAWAGHLAGAGHSLGASKTRAFPRRTFGYPPVFPESVSFWNPCFLPGRPRWLFQQETMVYNKLVWGLM